MGVVAGQPGARGPAWPARNRDHASQLERRAAAVAPTSGFGVVRESSADAMDELNHRGRIAGPGVRGRPPASVPKCARRRHRAAGRRSFSDPRRVAVPVNDGQHRSADERTGVSPALADAAGPLGRWAMRRYRAARNPGRVRAETPRDRPGVSRAVAGLVCGRRDRSSRRASLVVLCRRATAGTPPRLGLVLRARPHDGIGPMAALRDPAPGIPDLLAHGARCDAERLRRRCPADAPHDCERHQHRLWSVSPQAGPRAGSGARDGGLHNRLVAARARHCHSQ